MADLTTILSSGALSAVVVFLLRDWISERLKASIQHEYDQKLEAHKAKLQAQNDVELVRLKADLERAASEHSVRFARTYDKMAAVVAEVYKNLLAVQEAALRHVSTLETETKEQSGERLLKTLKTFADHYTQNRIYLPRQTSDKLWNFQATALVLIGNVARGDSPIIQKLLHELPEQLNALQNDFQKLLGCPFDEPPKQTEEKHANSKT